MNTSPKVLVSTNVLNPQNDIVRLNRSIYFLNKSDPNLTYRIVFYHILSYFVISSPILYHPNLSYSIFFYPVSFFTLQFLLCTPPILYFLREGRKKKGFIYSFLLVLFGLNLRFHVIIKIISTVFCRMRILCVITVSLLFGLAYCQLRKPKLYKVDLDKDPKLRWKEVIDDHLIYAPAIKQEARYV